MWERMLFKQVDNTALILFRIFFGALMCVETWGAIATGWVKKTFVDPTFTFTFIGFEWTHFLLGPTMYFYYFVMGILGIGIGVGYRYRWVITAFFLLWTLSYFMQKTHYNNHYYLIVLISFLMIFVPANRLKSLDAKLHPEIQSQSTPYWTLGVFQLQIALVYLFAAIAKLYPGWYNNTFISIRMKSSANWFYAHGGDNFISKLILKEPFQYFLTYAGLAFDFLIIPLLIFRKTRTIAFIALIVFHLVNSVLLQIGIFPFFAIALTVFYFSANTLNQWFHLKRKNEIIQPPYVISLPRWKNIIVFSLLAYFSFQLYLPIRHWGIDEDVLWTEEGHRLSWRMMLRTKYPQGIAKFNVYFPSTEKRETIDVLQFLNYEQAYTMSTKPDMIWQFVQFLKKEYAKKGYENVQIYVQSKISVNESEFFPLINETTDLASTKWNYFGHQSWILPTPNLYSKTN